MAIRLLWLREGREGKFFFLNLSPFKARELTEFPGP